MFAPTTTYTNKRNDGFIRNANVLFLSSSLQSFWSKSPILAFFERTRESTHDNNIKLYITRTMPMPPTEQCVFRCRRCHHRRHDSNPNFGPSHLPAHVCTRGNPTSAVSLVETFSGKLHPPINIIFAPALDFTLAGKRL